MLYKTISAIPKKGLTFISSYNMQQFFAEVIQLIARKVIGQKKVRVALWLVK